MEEKNYYAFISYSRSDAKVAQEIQRRLEKYPYPQHLTDQEHRPYDDRRVRPVFLDTTDLSVSKEDFTSEIEEMLKRTKYLIVLCSDASAKSQFVAKEINCFVESHNGDTSGIIPVIIDQVNEEQPPYISELLKTRNCPIWNTQKGENAKMDNQYCFYHILEYLLGVDFQKLFSRYLHYRRRKRFLRFTAILTVLLVCLGLSLTAWQKEREVSTFEKQTFPYSLVVGYTDNFLIPLLNTLVDSSATITPHVLIYLPYRYAESVHSKREKGYDNYLERTYDISYSENFAFRLKGRKRDLTGHRKKMKGYNCMLYTDNARTVVAIKEVVDFKQSQPRMFSTQSQDEMIKEYTDLFIKQTKEKLQEAIPNNPYIGNLHFITSRHVLDSVMNVIQEREKREEE